MATIGIEPLSEMRHPYAMQRTYGPDTPETFRRQEGDQLLLAALEKECERQKPWDGEPPRVCELPEHLLDDAVLEAERRTNGTWRLAGLEHKPILARLDEHFRPLQEAGERQRHAQLELRERRAAEDRQREEERARAWRSYRIEQILAELQAMDAVGELRDALAALDTPAETDWTPAFLEALERSGSVTQAAEAAGVGRRTVYDRRSSDEAFRAAWAQVAERE